MIKVSFLPPESGTTWRAAIAALLVTTALLTACTQAPTVRNEDPAVLQPKPAVVEPEVPPTVSAMPAIPPKDGAATSVGSAAGNVAPARAQPSAVQIATASSVTPAGITRYECVKGKQGQETRAAITFPENSGRICSRFPAMGPCQYERAACRASGGRVIRFDGVEITREVEHEYDKQVQRFRLNAG